MHFSWTTTKKQRKVTTQEFSNGCRVLQSDYQMFFKHSLTQSSGAERGHFNKLPPTPSSSSKV